MKMKYLIKKGTDFPSFVTVAATATVAGALSVCMVNLKFEYLTEEISSEIPKINISQCERYRTNFICKLPIRASFWHTKQTKCVCAKKAQENRIEILFDEEKNGSIIICFL